MEPTFLLLGKKNDIILHLFTYYYWSGPLNGPKFGAKNRSPTPSGPGKCRVVE